MMKFFFIVLLCLACQMRGLAGPGPADDLLSLLPPHYSFLMYGHALDRSFKEFKDSYFWKKYKQTEKGRDFDKTLDSINGSFLVIGLVLDDLLEILSERALLAVWLRENAVEDYVYLIEKKQNRSKIDSVVERLEYFAYANKIELSTVLRDGFRVYNFKNKVILADRADLLLVSNSAGRITEALQRGKAGNGAERTVNFRDYFSNENIVLYLKKTNEKIRTRDEYYYSFRFREKPRLEGLIRSGGVPATNAPVDSAAFRFLPANINALFSLGRGDMREYLDPFFSMVSTNIFQLDRAYFGAYFDPAARYLGAAGLCGIQRTAKNTNMIVVLTGEEKNRAVTDSFSSLTNASAVREVYGPFVIFKGSPYFVFTGGFLLLSNNLSFLKKGLEGYQKRSGFAWGSAFPPLKNTVAQELFLWLDLKEYVTALALKNGPDKWTYYNAYLKTFSAFTLYGKRKGDYLYLDGSF